MDGAAPSLARDGRAFHGAARGVRTPPETCPPRPRIAMARAEISAFATGMLMHVPSPRRSLPLLGDRRRPAAIEPRTVRLSLTDRCDLACEYCRPSRNDGYLERRLD